MGNPDTLVATMADQKGNRLKLGWNTSGKTKYTHLTSWNWVEIMGVGEVLVDGYRYAVGWCVAIQ